MSRQPTNDPLALDVRRLSKTYPGVRALDHVTLKVASGSVHGLVGENGAGKSTLLKSVSGAVRPDSGSVSVFGREVSSGDPRSATRAGMAMIYQELTILPDMSAQANVFLGNEPSRLGLLSRRRAGRRFAEVADQVGFVGSPQVAAGRLSTAGQQLLEIMRAIASHKRLLVMDEPTASLGPDDIRGLHEVIAKIRTQGGSVVYVSHDLDAVLAICDEITVMREGAVVETREAKDWNKQALVESMLGGVDLANAGPARRAATPRAASSLFTVRNVVAPGVNLDELTVRPGEILGIAGLVGSGRSRLLRALAGADPVRSGEWVDETGVRRWPRTTRSAMAAGVALAPEDRKVQGLVLSRSAAWNVALGHLSAAGGMVVTESGLRGWAEPTATRFGFAASRLGTPAGALSGGNQQKLLLSRLVAGGAKCLLLDEPTRGIDVGAKAQVFQALRDLADAGTAVVWSSSELQEVVEHSDRIVVVAGGRTIADLEGEVTVRQILDLCFSHARSTSPEVAA